MKTIDADEKDLLESVERGEWTSTTDGKRERTRYVRCGKATFRKDRRLNIRPHVSCWYSDERFARRTHA
jgi:hypothetical protein